MVLFLCFFFLSWAVPDLALVQLSSASKSYDRNICIDGWIY